MKNNQIFSARWSAYFNYKLFNATHRAMWEPVFPPARVNECIVLWDSDRVYKHRHTQTPTVAKIFNWSLIHPVLSYWPPPVSITTCMFTSSNYNHLVLSCSDVGIPIKLTLSSSLSLSRTHLTLLHVCAGTRMQNSSIRRKTWASGEKQPLGVEVGSINRA